MNFDHIEFKNNNGIDKQAIIKKYGLKDGDCGSTVVQIALRVGRINYLNEYHFSKHNKDKHSKFGLKKLVDQVKCLLKYLYKIDYKKYLMITEDLGIKKWLKSTV